MNVRKPLFACLGLPVLTRSAIGHECSRGVANLLTMAVFNIITDIALIVLPFPMLRHIRLDRKAYVPTNPGVVNQYRGLTTATASSNSRSSSASASSSSSSPSCVSRSFSSPPSPNDHAPWYGPHPLLQRKKKVVLTDHITVGIDRNPLRLHRRQHGLLLHRRQGPPGPPLPLPDHLQRRRAPGQLLPAEPPLLDRRRGRGDGERLVLVGAQDADCGARRGVPGRQAPPAGLRFRDDGLGPWSVMYN